MIDFRLNDKGDLIIGRPEEYERFKIKFVTGEFPKLRIVFKGEAEEKIAPESIFCMRFYVDENEKEHAKILETVKEDEEKAQSIAIRLKTELGELNSFYYDFGSELVDWRHVDLLNDTYWSKLTEKVKVAIQDIIPYEESSVSINRVYEDSNFQVETLRISILENGQFIGQYYCF